MSGTIVSINTVNYGSTGTIMRGISEEYRERGWDAYNAYGRYHKGNVPQKEDIIIGSKIDVDLHYLYARLTNRRALGPASRLATRKFVQKLDELQPNLIHLHNLHGYYINIEVLFDYLRRSGVKVRWTLHDCWAFTGHCGHFVQRGCYQWRGHCGLEHRCPQTHSMGSKGLIDSSKYNFEKKRELFCSLPISQLELVTPSYWLKDYVSESFLSAYPVRVVHNQVDAKVFKPTPSSFREKYGISNQFIVLGVASKWSELKGLNYFFELAEQLDLSEFAIVMVGLSKKLIGRLRKKGIVALPPTSSATELAEIYTAANVYVHPGIQETYGMTVAEACACGTHVIVREGSACVEAATGDASVVSTEEEMTREILRLHSDNKN